MEWFKCWLIPLSITQYYKAILVQSFFLLCNAMKVSAGVSFLIKSQACSQSLN